MKISRKRNYEYYWSFLSLFYSKTEKKGSKAEKYDRMMIEKKKNKAADFNKRKGIWIKKRIKNQKRKMLRLKEKEKERVRK